jgi:predicted secreted protein
MSLALSIAVYIVIWWTLLFAVLPFHTRTQEEAGEIVLGTPEGAPARFPIWRVIVINTVGATLVFGLVWLAVTSDIIPKSLFEYGAPTFTQTR